MASVLETGRIDFPAHPIPLNLSIANYIINPSSMDHLQIVVTEIHSLLNPLNSYYGRGFVQIVVADTIKRVMIYESSQFHLGLISHMLWDVMGTRGPGTWGWAWNTTRIIVTVCREFFPNSRQIPPTRIRTVKPDEGY